MAEWLNRHAIPYMLTGSLAFNVYATPRNTRDIDIVTALLPKHLPLIKEAFRGRFYFHEEPIQKEIAGRGVSMFNLIDNQTGYKIDFILIKNTLYEREKFNRRKAIILEAIDLNVISAEDLLVSKLQWIQQIQSPIQMNDIRTLWQLPNMDKPYILHWIKALHLATFNLLA